MGRCAERLAAVVVAGALLAGGVSGEEGAPAPRFRDGAEAAGLDFVHDNGARGDFFLPEIMGSGGALLDYDEDGDLDVFLVQGGPLAPAAARPPGSSARLFRNDLRTDGAGRPVLRFTDVTAGSGLAIGGAGMGAATGDYDGDGDPDLFVTAFGASGLHRNDGGGRFTDVTNEAGLVDQRWSTSAAFLDHDRDGDLDLFVVHYVDFTVAGNKVCQDAAGARDYCPPSSYRPLPPRFYRNEGGGRFTDATAAAGLTRAYGNGLGVSVGDYNGDGWLDLYVANDATPNGLWINRRDGTFGDEGLLSGAAVNAAGRPEGSMGIASGDFDEDGDEDLVVTNLTRETFVAYVNDGTGGFEDRRAEVGLAGPTAAMTGFGTGWFDYDNDGRLDLFCTNGAVNIVAALRGTAVPYRQRDQLFHNQGGGRLTDVSAAAGEVLARTAVGRGAAFGDVDNDGDVDILVTRNGGPVRLLVNDASGPGRGLVVRLAAASGNRRGMGARVGLEREDGRKTWRRAGTDGSYLSASDPRVHFGLGRSPRIAALLVEWPGGGRERFANVDLDRPVTLERGAGTGAGR